MAHQRAKETGVAGCGASLLVLTELGFVQRILLPRLEGEAILKDAITEVVSTMVASAA